MKESIPFYLDANFWIACIAFLALLVSLLPYIKKLIKSAKLEVDIYDSLWITHHAGNPMIQFNLIIKNIGGNKLSVKNIFIEVYRDNQEIVKLPLKNYLEKMNDSQFLPFKKITLEADSEWHHGARFLNFFSRSDSKKYKEAERNLKNELTRIRKESENDDLAEADKSFTKTFEELFNDHFKWKEGNYLIRLHIETDNKKLDIVKDIKFTIFESMTTEFEKDKERYVTGDRIYWYSDNYHGEWIDIESIE